MTAVSRPEPPVNEKKSIMPPDYYESSDIKQGQRGGRGSEMKT